MFHAAVTWECIALKWRALAKRRHDHHLDLYKSGRWRHYYTAEEFLAEMGKTVAMAERWATIAPLPEEREPPVSAAEPEQALAA
jgi:hypothetical protein